MSVLKAKRPSQRAQLAALMYDKESFSDSDTITVKR